MEKFTINKRPVFKAILLAIFCLLFTAGNLMAGNDGNKSFINWLLEEAASDGDEDESKESINREKGDSYDYFLDTNENGIDDRIEEGSQSERVLDSPSVSNSLEAAPSIQRRAAPSVVPSAKKSVRSKSTIQKVFEVLDDEIAGGIESDESQSKSKSPAKSTTINRSKPTTSSKSDSVNKKKAKRIK